jgi:hypothetical protein
VTLTRLIANQQAGVRTRIGIITERFLQFIQPGSSYQPFPDFAGLVALFKTATVAEGYIEIIGRLLPVFSQPAAKR